MTEIFSISSACFMVPFHVKSEREWVGTYNCEIGRALADLLPDEFPNRYRLAGEAFLRRLAEAVLAERRGEWSLLEAQAQFGDDLAALGGRFGIERSMFGNIGSFDVGNSDYSTYPSWNAALHDARLPRNVAIGVSLPVRDGRLASLDPFLDQIDAIEEGVMGVPWLAAYLATHPEVMVEIRFVTDRSLSTKAREGILETMTGSGRGKQALAIASSLYDGVLLEVDEGSDWSRWVLLPDGTLMLWHFKGRVPLGRTDEAVAAWDCNGFRCSGVLFGPDGRALVRSFDTDR